VESVSVNVADTSHRPVRASIIWKAEEAGVTFSGSDSTPVPKFLNPCPKFFF